MPATFAYPAAFGDLLAAVLAVVAIPFVVAEATAGKPLVWLFNVIGSLDVLAAVVLANAYDAGPYLGAAYWIPAFWVPALLVTHYLTFVVLWRDRTAGRIKTAIPAGESGVVYPAARHEATFGAKKHTR